MHKKIAGIDYGSKLAGTTVVAWNDQDVLQWEGSAKKEDADKWLEDILSKIQPDLVFLDAPLSLPGVYTGKGEDYFYREGDRLLHAMSPMFLGGLTARAMRLKATLEKMGIPVFETYPAAVVEALGEQKLYYQKKSKEALPEFLENFKAELPYPWKKEPNTWHAADAILAWLGGYRYISGKARSYGNKEEGIIWI